MEDAMTYVPLKVKSSSLSDAECMWLFEKASGMESVAEIGSFMGRSTHALLSGCKGPVWAVDHFQGSPEPIDATYGKSGREEFYKNVGSFPNLKVFEMDSVNAANLFEDKSVDMVFIDASHLYEDVLADIKAWTRVCKKLLCGHDYQMPSVLRAIREVHGENHHLHLRMSIWEVNL